MKITNPSIIPRIEQFISNREYNINSTPARRGMRQTCYLFGGYGSDTDDINLHLLTSSYRCQFTINDSPSLYSIEIEQVHGDEMRYPRMHHQIAALGILIYIIGGEVGDNIFNTADIFHIEKNSWIRTNDLPIRVYGATGILR